MALVTSGSVNRAIDLGPLGVRLFATLTEKNLAKSAVAPLFETVKVKGKYHTTTNFEGDGYLSVRGEAEAFASGRKIRVTKVPFSATPKALINNDSRGFVKIISDPATGVVLGGSIVGRHAAELISVIALAVTANLKVSDIVESLLVHPALAEALAEAAE